jgi:uncharacterized protein YndB with AHSA1/START domain
MNPEAVEKATDHIEKKILLRATRARVWRALTDSTEFGTWFGMEFASPFTPGAVVRAVIVGTKVNADVAKMQKQYEGIAFDITIDRIEPERLFSFRWHPGAVEPGYDYASEPSTLVTFSLDEAPEGILLTVTESGFDQIPLARRAQAFSGNEQGWSIVVTLLKAYLEQNA